MTNEDTIFAEARAIVEDDTMSREDKIELLQSISDSIRDMIFEIPEAA